MSASGGVLTITGITSCAFSGNLTYGTAGSTLSGTTGSQGITLVGTNQSFTISPSGSGLVVVSCNIAGDTGLMSTNVSNASNASSFVRVAYNSSAGTALGLYTFGPGRSASGLVNPNSSYLATSSGLTNGLTLATETTAPLILATNSTTALTINGTTQNITLSFAYIGSTDTRSGAGAVSVTKETTKVTTAGVGDALTLADGVDGQTKIVVLDVLTSGGHTAVLTPTTKTGFSTITFTAAGQTAMLKFYTTRGWMVIGNYLSTIAP